VVRANRAAANAAAEQGQIGVAAAALRKLTNDPGESLIGATFHPKIADPGFFGDFLREIIACNLDARRQAVKTGCISRNKSGV
jgi:hypothetical protein